MKIKEINEQQLQIFSKNIKLLRKKIPLNQSQMAELLNISVYSLRKLEKGIVPKKLSVEVVLNIIAIFKINPFRPI